MVEIVIKIQVWSTHKPSADTPGKPQKKSFFSDPATKALPPLHFLESFFGKWDSKKSCLARTLLNNVSIAKMQKI